MPKYRYTTVDALGKPLVGRLEAAGPDEALAALAAQGIDVDPANLEEIPEEMPGETPAKPAQEPPEPAAGTDRLSTTEAAEVADSVAQLAKANLPLGAGLRAMADELPRRKISRVLRQIARQVEAGTPLEAAIEARRRQFPAHVRGLILAGVKTGRLSDVLEQFVALHRERVELRRRVWLSLAYPSVLMAGLIALFVFLSLGVIPAFATIFSDFGMDLPAITQMLLWSSQVGMQILLGLAIILVPILLLLWLMPRPTWLQRVFYQIPILGPVWRWQSLVEFSRLMQILLHEQVPLPEALRLTADGLEAPHLAAACRQSAEQIEAGGSFSDCLTRYWPFPPSLKPFVDSGMSTLGPPEGFRAAAEAYERRTTVDLTLWEIIIPPIMLVVVAVGVGFTVLALFMPLLKLITTLT